jgi:RNA polymerase sigma factor (sigma-70 family)
LNERVESTSVVSQIESLFDGGSAAGMTDRELLERFVSRRDSAGESAFAALVYRHGPMVLGLCSQLTGNRHDAEDAFQAVFLVLARKAASMRQPDLLANWLYGVALRTARKAKTRLARQRRFESGDGLPSRAIESTVTAGANGSLDSTSDPALGFEETEALHAEIERLPKSFRLPIVLCYFDGLTLDAAARRLNCPPGTVRSRLARARDKLRRGLTRRGIILPTAAVAAALTPRSASAAVPASLCDATTRGAIRFLAPHSVSTSATVTALARDVLRSMLHERLRFAAIGLFALGAVIVGGGFLSHAVAQKDELKESPLGQRPSVAGYQQPTNQHPTPGHMFVVGRVLDPQGKPVPNANVTVYVRLKQSAQPYLSGHPGHTTAQQGRCDESGRFRLDTVRTSSARHETLSVAAMAPGFGIGWTDIDPDTDLPGGEIALRVKQLIRGRLFDIQGRPAQGVKVSVAIIAQPAHGRFESLLYQRNETDDLPAWPDPATSDAEGRFELRGLGRGVSIVLAISDPRFASWWASVETAGAVGSPAFAPLMAKLKVEDGAGSRPITVALQPAQTLTGRVTYADTGKPVPRAPIAVASRSNDRGGSRLSYFRADKEGRFRINPSPGDAFNLTSQAAPGEPYLTASKEVEWPKGAVEQAVNLTLIRGIAIEGRITEDGSGKPVVGALVRFTPYESDRDNANAGAPSATNSDGSFKLAAVPSAGYVVAQGPSDDYVLREMGAAGGLYFAKPGSRRFYAHGYHFLDLNRASARAKVDFALRRGTTVQCSLTGPDDRLVSDVSVLSQVIVRTPPSGGWKIWDVTPPARARGGHFELHGLDPDSEVPVYFLDSEHELGATVRISGKSAASGPVTVRLDRCGAAWAHLVDGDGKTLGKRTAPIAINLIVTPGATRSRVEKPGRVFANAAFLNVVDPAHYSRGTTSDADGRISLPALIPGATYSIYDRTTSNNDDGPKIRKEFRVKPGETVDLGDILIEKPENLR